MLVEAHGSGHASPSEASARACTRTQTPIAETTWLHRRVSEQATGPGGAPRAVWIDTKWLGRPDVCEKEHMDGIEHRDESAERLAG